MAVACSLVTALVFAIPPIRFGYPVPAVTVFVVGLLFASAAVDRDAVRASPRELGHVSDLLVALVFAVSVPLELLMPIAEGVFPSASGFAYWCRFAARLLIAAGLCKAAWIDHTFARPVKRNTTIAIALAGAALLMLVTLLCLPWLPRRAESETHAPRC